MYELDTLNKPTVADIVRKRGGIFTPEMLALGDKLQDVVDPATYVACMDGAKAKNFANRVVFYFQTDFRRDYARQRLENDLTMFFKKPVSFVLNSNY